ncbi:MAG: thioredoxin [Candidatus Eisenbacteria bacterium]|nr:thioredoxin [Candidatus Eisenbacteria bacterium]
MEEIQATKPLHVTSATFDSEVLKSTIPVLVDFWAEWCMPCLMVAPIVEDIAQDYAGRVKVCKLNVDDSQSLASRYGIRSIPSLLIFKGGSVVNQVIGAVPKSELVKRLEQVLRT